MEADGQERTVGRRCRQATAGSSAGRRAQCVSRPQSAPRRSRTDCDRGLSVLSPVRPERNAAPGCSSVRSGLRRPADYPGTGHHLRYYSGTGKRPRNPSIILEDVNIAKPTLSTHGWWGALAVYTQLESRWSNPLQKLNRITRERHSRILPSWL